LKAISCHATTKTAMNRAFKTFLLYLLMALLPLGSVAAVRSSCGEVHTVLTSTVSHSPCDAAVHSAASDQQSPSAPEKSPHPDTATTCGMCFLGAAMASGHSLVAIASSSQDADHPPASAFTDFIPSGLERPPR